ncbi:MAG: hypothetical protein NUW09_03480 [Deltaproteobacteria bacterium]|nr:hypothetical protein [Deltaproteobacteria bacterium]
MVFTLEDDSFFLSNEILIIVFVYTLSYGLTLLNTGLYLDDFVMTGFYQNPAHVLGAYKELGYFLYWPAFLHILAFKLQPSAGVFIERLVIFLSYLFSALFLCAALKKVDEIDRASRITLIVFFAVMPVNFSRIVISNINSALCNLFFFAGLCLLAGYFEKKSLLRRLAALVLFFFSFSTNSFLVFYLIAIAFIAYHERRGFKPGLLPALALRYLDFLAAPVVFWVIKALLFKPYGAYGGYYNVVDAGGIAAGAAKTLLSFSVFYGLLKKTVFVFDFITLFFIVIAATLLYFFYALKGRREDTENNRARSLFFLCLGAFAYLIAVFPYAAVGKVYVVDNWSDRHALLVPLGASLFLYYALRFAVSRRTLVFASAALIALFVSADIRTLLRFQRQAFKQRSLMEQIKSSEVIRDNRTFLFIDETKDYDGFKSEPYRQYEWTCLFKVAYGDETRNGWTQALYKSEEPSYYDLGIYAKYKPRYCIGGYEPGKPQYEVIVKKGGFALDSRLDVARLLFRNVFHMPKAQEDIKEILRLEYRKLEG